MTNLRILIVDDEQVIRDALKDIFTHLGHTVETVDNGSDAYQLLKTTKYDMIVMDVQMPIMTGIDSVKAIREIDQSVYILIMSGYCNELDAQEGILSGAEGFVRKPFNIDAFEDHIAKAILKKMNLNLSATILTMSNKKLDF